VGKGVDMNQITMIEKILETLPKGTVISQDLFNSLVVWVDSYIFYNKNKGKVENEGAKEEIRNES
jgi:hypothetical protein